MFYIKLKEDKELEITSKEPIYRGENLNQHLIFLLPMKIDDIDLQVTTVYMSNIRADGVADVIELERDEVKYNESYYQYKVPVTCRLTKYPGQVCVWLTIYSGDIDNPVIAKSGECMLFVQDSKNLDDYICDHQLTAIYRLKKEMDENVEEIHEELAGKADNIIYHEEDHTIQLTAGGVPIGNRIVISTSGGAGIVNMEIREDGILYVTYDDGRTESLGKVVGDDGKIYIPSINERKVLSWVIDDKPGAIPEPVDLNPNDEWEPVEEDGESEYPWEDM